jgi:uncharacterized membrane protein YhiD involved in acid resistance
MAVSLVLGVGTAFIFMFRNTYSKGFVVTLALLPSIVSLVIMMVNGNIGAGVAVAGAFSLVRFRSIPGGAKEICSIFFAMALGLTVGMGYVAAAALFFVIIGAVMLLLSVISFGEQRGSERELKITIPENLDYEGLFDDIFQKYTKNVELIRAKTTNLGTLYELHYHITLCGQSISKDFLDALRCRNGNLNIVCGRKSSGDTL